MQSHPSWVCGLKQRMFVDDVEEQGVTPFVGVWIETVIVQPMDNGGKASHPSWVCGLKPLSEVVRFTEDRSHPSWVCGLKQQKENKK